MPHGPDDPAQPAPPGGTAQALPRMVLRLADLAARRATPFTLDPDAAGRAAVAAALDIPAVRKLRLSGRLVPIGRQDWRLEADLGATVVQDCVVTFAPVTTRIDEAVARSYLADLPEPEPGETEMPEDDEAEALPAAIDIAAVMIEALALALPVWPRAEGVPPADISVTAPGAAPLTDETARPFAGLAGLRDKLTGDTGEDGGDGGTGA